MVRSRDLTNDAVHSSYLDMRSRTLGAIRKHRTCGMGVRHDQGTAEAIGDCHVPCILRALVCLAASGRRLHHDERRIRSKRGANALVAHGSMFGISARSTAFRTALQKGINFGCRVGHIPRLNTFPASSRPPASDLNQFCECFSNCFFSDLSAAALWAGMEPRAA